MFFSNHKSKKQVDTAKTRRSENAMRALPEPKDLTEATTQNEEIN
jgi:hypothetical protein